MLPSRAPFWRLVVTCSATDVECALIERGLATRRLPVTEDMERGFLFFVMSELIGTFASWAALMKKVTALRCTLSAPGNALRKCSLNSFGDALDRSMSNKGG